MRHAFRALLTAAIALTAAAIVASPAAAQESPIELVEEETGNHCTDVTIVDHEAQGGCHITAFGEGIRLENPSLGFTTVCNWHFEARLQEDASGWIYNQTLENSPEHGNCFSEPLREPDGHPVPWQIISAGETSGAPHPEHLVFEFHLVNHIPFFGEIPTHCTIEVQANQINHEHVALEANQAGCQENSTHVTGAWTSQSQHPGGLELSHL